MSCVEWQDRIAQYAGNDLPEAEAIEVRRHLADCPDCAELASLMADDRSRLHSRPPELAAMDFDAMRRDLRSRVVRERRVKRWIPVGAIAAALVAALLIPGRTDHQIVQPVQRAEASAPPPVMQSPPAPPLRSSIVHPPAPLAPDVAMRLTTADPDVTIILLPVTEENPNE
jgi:anti-sigma factor RsiW